MRIGRARYNRALDWIFILGVGALIAVTLGPRDAAAQVNVLYSFCTEAGCADGGSPEGVIMDGAGNLYGTTVGGGAHGDGTVFQLTPNAAQTKWTETVLYSFCTERNSLGCIDGYQPDAGLIMDGAGNLYGTTHGGGAEGEGAVFQLSPNAARTKWTETVLYSFCAFGCGGESPFAGLIMDAAGHLYGTAEAAGAHGNGGVVFELTPNAARTKWTETVLYNFCSVIVGGFCTDGESPFASLIMDKAGNLYGTTHGGGAHGVYGTVFELTPNAARTKWTETVLHSFCSVVVGGICTDGEGPRAGLIMDKAGNLYGTTPEGGGAQEAGVVFELTPNAARTKWTETVLHTCSVVGCPKGGSPTGLIMDGSGRLYGTAGGGAHGGGVVFELTP